MSLLESWLPFDAMPTADRAWQSAHGEHCACLLLAAAVGARPDAVSCDYCHNVLQKHWEVPCDHGHRAPPKTAASDRLRGLGQLDAVKAVLIKES